MDSSQSPCEVYIANRETQAKFSHTGFECHRRDATPSINVSPFYSDYHSRASIFFVVPSVVPAVSMDNSRGELFSVYSPRGRDDRGRIPALATQARVHFRPIFTCYVAPQDSKVASRKDDFTPSILPPYSKESVPDIYRPRKTTVSTGHSTSCLFPRDPYAGVGELSIFSPWDATKIFPVGGSSFFVSGHLLYAGFTAVHVFCRGEDRESETFVKGCIGQHFFVGEFFSTRFYKFVGVHGC